MTKLLAGLLLLAAVLAGSLVAGSPVSGDATAAASIAGISLGTPAPSAGSRIQPPPVPPRIPVSRVWLLLVVLLSSAVAVTAEVEDRYRSPIRWHRPGRRGPPALA